MAKSNEEVESQESSDQEVENSGLRAMLARHNNDAMALAAELYNQTYQLREQRRALRKDVERLQQQVPEEGAVVLSGDEAKAWETYRQMGKPDDIRSQLDTAKKDRRDLLVNQAAALHGFNQKVLRKLLGDAELTVEQKDGQDVFHVGEGKEAKPLADLVETEWNEFVPALAGSKRNGKPVLGQAGAQESSSGDAVADYLARIQPTSKEGTK